jgi:ribosomal protein L7/L12
VDIFTQETPMITNLLDKMVKGHDVNRVPVWGKICAIFNPNGNGFNVGVIDSGTGKIHTCYSNSIGIYNDSTSSVIMFHSAESKIRAIKLLRQVQNLGLKEAKDLVESSPERIVVKRNLTWDEAVRLQMEIASEGLESEIRTPINSITQE